MEVMIFPSYQLLKGENIIKSVEDHVDYQKLLIPMILKNGYMSFEHWNVIKFSG